MQRSNPSVGLLLLGLCCCAPALADWSREAGGLFLRSFTPKDYQASPQNWAVVEDQRGVMYFGNTECVLEYDGVSWRKIPVSNGSGVRSLATDESGTVYVRRRAGRFWLPPTGCPRHDALRLAA